MQQLLLDSEFGAKIPSDFRYYESIEEKNINDEKPTTESFIKELIKCQTKIIQFSDYETSSRTHSLFRR